VNVFVPENSKVRVFVNKRGEVLHSETNVIPTLTVEVVGVGDEETVEDVKKEFSDSLPFVV
jgi:hypothetical protein